MPKEGQIKISNSFKEFLRREKQGGEDFEATINRLISTPKASVPHEKKTNINNKSSTPKASVPVHQKDKQEKAIGWDVTKNPNGKDIVLQKYEEGIGIKQVGFPNLSKQ